MSDEQDCGGEERGWKKLAFGSTELSRRVGYRGDRKFTVIRK
jgi:hypothetical protein